MHRAGGGALEGGSFHFLGGQGSVSCREGVGMALRLPVCMLRAGCSELVLNAQLVPGARLSPHPIMLNLQSQLLWGAGAVVVARLEDLKGRAQRGPGTA